MLGAGGGIGQPLSLLLKMNRMVTELSLYDVANVGGVAADLSHCNTPTQVQRAGAGGAAGGVSGWLPAGPGVAGETLGGVRLLAPASRMPAAQP